MLLFSGGGIVPLRKILSSPEATRQNFPCKYTFLTDFNASLWLFSSVNHETFLEIYFA